MISRVPVVKLKNLRNSLEPRKLSVTLSQTDKTEQKLDFLNFLFSFFKFQHVKKQQ